MRVERCEVLAPISHRLMKHSTDVGGGVTLVEMQSVAPRTHSLL